MLFRYSALTFNGHKIHYDRTWAREREGHPDLVVHGPLTATLLVEIANVIASGRQQCLERFEYRATCPIYVDRDVTMGVSVKADERVELVAKQDGRVGMRATAMFK